MSLTRRPLLEADLSDDLPVPVVPAPGISHLGDSGQAWALRPGMAQVEWDDARHTATPMGLLWIVEEPNDG